jgi:S1-C subfamily serine protease
MATDQSGGLLWNLSEEIAQAVEKGAKSLVAVHGRRRLPSSGVAWWGGVIVTSDHALERDEDIQVTLPDGKKAPAKLAGRDPGSDVAVLTVPGAQLTPIEVAPPGSVKVGHFVLALGRPSTEAPMASFGVISALGGAWRTARGGVIEGYLQADVTLYPGFSGGPLLDAQGRFVGLNSSYLARGHQSSIPAAALEGIVTALQTSGRVKRAFLGISSQPVTLPQALAQRLGVSQEDGLMILRVEPGSPAERGGVLLGDVLVGIGGKPVTDAEELQRALGPDAVGKPLTVAVIRGGEKKDLSVTPSERT